LIGIGERFYGLFDLGDDVFVVAGDVDLVVAVDGRIFLFEPSDALVHFVELFYSSSLTELTV
jgi:hypothetical protein